MPNTALNLEELSACLVDFIKKRPHVGAIPVFSHRCQSAEAWIQRNFVHATCIHILVTSLKPILSISNVQTPLFPKLSFTVSILQPARKSLNSVTLESVAESICSQLHYQRLKVKERAFLILLEENDFWQEQVASGPDRKHAIHLKFIAMPQDESL